MRNTVMAAGLAVAMVAPASAETLQPGQLYGGGTVLDVPDYGISVQVPDGWNALLPPDGVMLMMTPDDVSYVFALAADGTLEEARTFLAETTIPLGGGVFLQPAAPPVDEGDGLLVLYSVLGVSPPHVAVGRARAVTDGVMVATFAVAPDGSLGPADDVSIAFLGQVALLESPPPAPADPQTATGAQSGSGSDDDWHTYLLGRHLVRYSGDYSYREAQHLYLCANGHFRRSFSSGGFTPYGADAASGATASADAGQWHATGTGNEGTLVLQYGDGSRADIYLEWKQNKVFLDGVQWLRDPENNYCR